MGHCLLTTAFYSTSLTGLLDECVHQTTVHTNLLTSPPTHSLHPSPLATSLLLSLNPFRSPHQPIKSFTVCVIDYYSFMVLVRQTVYQGAVNSLFD